MLNKTHSLKKARDFSAVFKRAKIFKNNLFVLKAAKNNLGLSRFGFVVSQKVSKKATTRNRVKRWLSEAAKDGLKSTKAGMDFVLIALPGIEKSKFSDVKEALLKTLKELT